jgi:hypothetical protein
MNLGLGLFILIVMLCVGVRLFSDWYRCERKIAVPGTIPDGAIAWIGGVVLVVLFSGGCATEAQQWLRSGTLDKGKDTIKIVDELDLTCPRTVSYLEIATRAQVIIERHPEVTTHRKAVILAVKEAGCALSRAADSSASEPKQVGTTRTLPE